MIPGALFRLVLLTALANSQPAGSETRTWGWVVILAILEYVRFRK